MWPHYLLCISTFKLSVTVSQKEVLTFKLYVTLSNFNRFSKFLHCWKPYEICYNTHLALGMLLRYLGILKIQIFCKYSADMENANKLHFQYPILIPLYA